MRNQTRDARELLSAGFTLVELLVAMTILAIGILSVGQIFAISSRNAAYSRAETTAVSLVREVAEKIQSEAVDQVGALFDGVDTAVPGTVTAPCQEWANHLATQMGPTGRGRIWVRDPNEDLELAAGMLSVRIEVSWLSRGDSIRVPLQFALTDISG